MFTSVYFNWDPPQHVLRVRFMIPWWCVQVTPEEMREKMKKLGISPPTMWQEKPIYISSTGTILDQFVPPEGDGKASLVSAAGAKQVSKLLKTDWL